MRVQLVLAAALLVVETTQPAVAHHSFAAVFDAQKPVRLQGTLSKIEWENPHVHIYLAVPSSNGEVHTWTCESGNPGVLLKNGWKTGTIKVGDRLIVDGYLAKDGSRFIDAQRVTLPDGRRLSGDNAGPGSADTGSSGGGVSAGAGAPGAKDTP